MESAPPPAPACARCGRDAQFDFDRLWLCLECYHVAGSTCAGVNRPEAGSRRTGTTQPGASSDSVC